MRALAKELNITMDNARWIVTGVINVIRDAIIKDGEAFIPTVVRIKLKNVKDHYVIDVNTKKKKLISGSRKLSAKFINELSDEVRYLKEEQDE